MNRLKVLGIKGLFECERDQVSFYFRPERPQQQTPSQGTASMEMAILADGSRWPKAAYIRKR